MVSVMHFYIPHYSGVTVSFEPIEYTVGEGDGTANLMLVKMGVAGVAITVRVATTPGSADGKL